MRRHLGYLLIAAVLVVSYACKGKTGHDEGMAQTMPTSTPRFGLTYSVEGAINRDVVINELITKLDILTDCVVQSMTTTAPPGSPTEGDCYYVPDSATGAWSGYDYHIAGYYDGQWVFVSAPPGTKFTVLDQGPSSTGEQRIIGPDSTPYICGPYHLQNATPATISTDYGNAGDISWATLDLGTPYQHARHAIVRVQMHIGGTSGSNRHMTLSFRPVGGSSSIADVYAQQEASVDGTVGEERTLLIPVNDSGECEYNITWTNGDANCSVIITLEGWVS